ncbi:hypothetical protein B1A99_34970 [Cohnella sp. CIP 111063]|uniref:IS66 family insertion sequence element accessory protein TnpA n=1 Tax=unclassified Cohnella TaxID=2636738 RepID=UPI000B8C6D81|nr:MULTISPECIES: hypothetical protein [unclassified Cohnella]OXS52138.1 hypothetical protein B1A99_34970 [Cohnella sp. CIP 111063]PRX53242.1 hypothetical protein B0G52_1471 [Cohnella sp. SGD-V74]
MARAEVQQKWETRVAAFRASGERATSWCKVNEVNRRQLYAWMKRLGGSSEGTVSASKPIPFVQVAVAPEAAARPIPSIRIQIGAATIEVDAGFNTALLRDVVQALEGVC